MATKASVILNDDYAVLETKKFYFYYGYEHVWCPTHEKFTDAPSCSGTNGDGDGCETEWCFYAANSASSRDPIKDSAIKCSDLAQDGEPAEYLLLGIAEFLDNRK